MAEHLFKENPKLGKKFIEELNVEKQVVKAKL